MTNRVFGLLVGINDYGAEVPSLAGCLNDVDRFHAYLTRQVEPPALAVRVLRNEEATRAAIIDGFRSHLRQAGEGDVAVFQFSGHGAQWASNPAFREFCPDGKDEGLVCFDSRRENGYDLADKELAVLIDEVAIGGAHVAVVLDSCHSGSGTRGIDTHRGLKPRLIAEVKAERPLETYLDGHYSRLRGAQQDLFIPEARHILLSACERGQLAQESSDDRGVFTTTLLDVLEASGGNLSYADLFVRCRAAVRGRAFDQDPQFETFNRFDASAGFLGRPVARGAARYFASCRQDGAWIVECGAINGVPCDLGATATVALYPEGDSTTLAGTARVVQVGPQKSEIELDFESAESVRYLAEVTSLNPPPLAIVFLGDEPSRVSIERALNDQGANVALVDRQGSAAYVLTPAGDDLSVARAGTRSTLRSTSPADLAPILRHIGQWERSLALQNQRTTMSGASVDLIYAQELPGGTHRIEASEALSLTYVHDGDELRGRLKAENHTAQTLHLMLVYFSEDFGVHVLRNEPLDASAAMTLWGADPPDFFFLEKGQTETVEKFKLIVSTEKVDDFLIAQPTLTDFLEARRATRDISLSSAPMKGVLVNEWFTKDFRARVTRSPGTAPS
ncbi:MAG: caspase family protein [Vicinamibacteria bacterium]